MCGLRQDHIKAVKEKARRIDDDLERGQELLGLFEDALERRDDQSVSVFLGRIRLGPEKR